MSLKAAVSGLVFFLLCVQGVQGQYGWRVTYSSIEICAVKGSTVEIRCRYTYPSTSSRVEKAFWFTKMKDDEYVDLTADSEYTGRVQYSNKVKDCTLRISQLKDSDSGLYKFRFTTDESGGKYTGSPGVTLSVTDLSVQVESKYSNTANLKCRSSCDVPENNYVWYKNGVQIQTKTSSLQVDMLFLNSYSCAVRGFEDSPSPSVWVQGPNGWRVTYSSIEICAVKGSTVEIRCSYTYPFTSSRVEKAFWFTKMKDDEYVDLTADSEYTGRVQYSNKVKDCTLRISQLKDSDSGLYKFRFTTDESGGKYTGSPGVTLSVTDLSVQVESTNSNTANLKCGSSCGVPENNYVWYKKDVQIQTKTSSSLQVDMSYLNSYSCAVRGVEDSPSPSVCVTGHDSNRVTYTQRSICAPKGSSVDISCTYSSYECITSKFWFRPERSHQGQNPSQPEDLSEDSQYEGRVQVPETERGRSTLRISDLRDSDSAQYLFTFKTASSEWGRDLPGTTLTVTALQVQVIRATVDRSSTYINAELKCRSSCSPAASASFVWFKNREKISTPATSSYQGWIQLADVISCAFEGHEKFPSPPVYAPKLPSVSVSPSAEIEEGSSVTLTCSSDANPAANYTWYKRDGNSYIPLFSKEQQLVFSSIQSSDSGQYSCRAENELGGRRPTNTLIDVKFVCMNITSSTLTLNTGAPQGCVLSPLLYSLFTHDCVATHSSNTIIKFADDTTVIGLITDGDETAYREEVRALTSWCQDNNLHLNVSKTKELIVDYRKRQREAHTPITIDGTPVERVSSFRFLGVNISEDLTWTHHTRVISKTARQRLFFLRRLRKFNMDSRILCNFYRCTIESILTGCITAWYGSCTALNRKTLQRVVKTAQHNARTELPSMEDLYSPAV
ncbi:titin-like [Eleginops maclovinus]|uniref:titin-like n=1 Tax=Eleginops maclovinus TaxID=56733 RepID=UPI0030809644